MIRQGSVERCFWRQALPNMAALRQANAIGFARIEAGLGRADTAMEKSKQGLVRRWVASGAALAMAKL